MKAKARWEEMVEGLLVQDINNELDDIYSISILAKDHGKPECKEAKEKEIENLMNF